MCPMLEMAKTQTIRVWNKERISDQEGTNQEDGRPNSASNPPSLQDQAKGFLMGYGDRYVEVLVGQVLIRGTLELGY